MLRTYDLGAIQLPADVASGVQQRLQLELDLHERANPVPAPLLTEQGHIYSSGGYNIIPTTVSVFPSVTGPVSVSKKGSPRIRSARQQSAYHRYNPTPPQETTPPTEGPPARRTVADIAGIVSPIAPSVQQSKFNSDMQIMKEVLTQLEPSDLTAIKDDFAMYTDKREPGATDVSVEAFVAIVWQHIHRALTFTAQQTSPLKKDFKLRFISVLAECFHQIDADHAGSVNYEAFINFLVTLSTEDEGSRVDYVPLYKPADLVDHSRHEAAVHRARYFSTQELLAVIEENAHVFKLFNVDTFKPLATLGPHLSSVLDVCFAEPYGAYVAVDSDKSLSFWDVSSYRLLQRRSSPIAQTVCTYSNVLNRVITGGMDGSITLWHPETMVPNVYPAIHSGAVQEILEIPYLEMFGSAASDATVMLWDKHTGSVIRSLKGHHKSVNHIEYLPLHRMIVTAGADHDARVWNPLVDRHVTVLTGHCHPLVGCALIPESPELITGDSSGLVRIWDVRTFKCVQSMSAEGFDIRFHPMTALVGTTTTSKRVILAGSRLHALQAEAVDDPVTSDHTVMVGVGFSDASLSFAAASAHVVKVWDAESGKLLRLYRSPTASEITRMCPTKDGRLFAVSDAGGAVSVLNYTTGQLVKNLPGHSGAVHDLCCAGEYVISGGADGSVHVVNQARCKSVPREGNGGSNATVRHRDGSGKKRSGDARLIETLHRALAEDDTLETVGASPSAAYEGGVVEGLLELRHFEAARFLEENILSRSGSRRASSTRTSTPADASSTYSSRTVVSGDAAPSFVFQNDCRGSERGFTSSAATSRVSTASSRGRGSQSPPRHGKRLPRSGISCVTACPTETGKNILTYRESKQYQKLVQERLKWGRQSASMAPAPRTRAGHSGSTSVPPTLRFQTPKPPHVIPSPSSANDDKFVLFKSDDVSTEAPTESSDGFGQINYKSTFGEIAGSFRPQSSLGSRRVEDAARSRAPVTSGTGGDVALKFSEPLLVASASQDFTIVVWDATPSRHKPIGLCTGHTSEIVALQFAYPYPILLSADVTGVIIAWDLSRRQLSPAVLAYAHNKHYAGPGRRVQSAVVSMAWDSHALEVFTADEFGFVKSFDLRPVVESLVLQEALRRRQSRKSGTMTTTGEDVDDDPMVDLAESTAKHTPVMTPARLDPASSTFGFGMDPSGPTAVKQRQRLEKHDTVFLTGIPSLGGPPRSFVHRLLQISSWRAHDGAIQTMTMIDSDSMEEMVLATSGTDLRVRLWNLAGVHLGSLLHGPHVLARRRLLDALFAEPRTSAFTSRVGCGSSLTDDVIRRSQSRADPECKLLNGTHPGLDEVNTTADTSLSIAWSNGRGHPTAIRQVVRGTLNGRRPISRTVDAHLAYRVPTEYLGVLDFEWSVQTHRRIQSAREVIKSALLLRRVAQTGVTINPPQIDPFESQSDKEVIQMANLFTTKDFIGGEEGSGSTADESGSVVSGVSALVGTSEWQRARRSEARHYTEFLADSLLTDSAREEVDMAAEPLPPTVDDTIDEELLVSAREMFTKHLQSDRRPVKWITSVERAWSKSGRALKAGKAHTSANARVTGYVPGYAGQAVWVSPSAHRKPVHSDLWMMPSESPPPKTSHRKLQQSRTQSFAAPRIAVRPMTPNPKVKPAIPRPSPPESPRHSIGRPPSRARAVMMSSEAPVAMDPLSSRSPVPQSQTLVVTSRPTTAAALLGLQ